MIKQKVIIQNNLGLHTRAAAKLVDTAKHYQSRIELVLHDHTIDCKSIMSVITLGAQKDNELDLIVEGEDEQQASEAVVSLVNNKFGEYE